MPRELYAPDAREVAYREIDDPPVGEGQVRAEAEFGAVKHGTELTVFRGTSPYKGHTWDPDLQLFVPTDKPTWQTFPIAIGNMLVARVTEVGPGVEGLAVGDRVARYSSLRETAVWQADGLRKLPEGMSWKAAVCLDPADFAMAAVRDGNVRVGDDVAVFGLGAIGLFIVQLVRLSGARRIVAFDPLPMRRELAEQLGADLVLDPTQCDAGLETKRFCDRRGADVTLDTSGDHRALHHAIRGVAYGGNVVAVAWPKECTGGLDFGQEAHHNRPNLIFARACSDPGRDHPRWDERRIFDTCWAWLASGTLIADPIVHPVVPFAQAGDAWLEVDRDPSSSIKLGIEFQLNPP